MDGSFTYLPTAYESFKAASWRENSKTGEPFGSSHVNAAAMVNR